MAKQPIQIDTWEMDLNLIKVSSLKNNIPVDYDLSIAKFEAFTDRHDKRDYCSDSKVSLYRMPVTCHGMSTMNRITYVRI